MLTPSRLHASALVALAAGLLALEAPLAQSTSPFPLEHVFAYPFPTELTASGTGSRLAWAFNEQGRRNIWVAEGPSFHARRVTSYDEDDGQELTGVALTRTGDRVVYVRGGDHGSNWDDDVPVNAVSSPLPPRVGIWSVPFAGGAPALLGDGDLPAISPRGDVVAFEKDRHVWLVPIDAAQPAKRVVGAAGTNGGIVWSPDGSRFAFVSSRGSHAFVGVYTDERTPIRWMAPSTSRDSSPRWSPDGTRLVFVRRPGSGGPPPPILEPRHVPWALWTADVATGAGREVWKAPATLRGSWPTTHGNANLHWAARGRIVFLSYADGWPHLYSIPESGGEALLLTPGNYMGEHVTLAPDGTHLVFAGNAGRTADDIDRRHVVRVPVDRAEPEVLTPGTGLEWAPVVTGDLGHVAFVGATAQRPPLPTILPRAGGTPRTLASDRIPSTFPSADLVTPRAVTYKASDGVEVHAQLFQPAGAPGRRPAIVYVHGGPPRQMLLGWHYSDYYARAYALNQYLASRGFLVLSINFRLGIGYGYEFHRPPGAGALGASEYLDVKAAGEYLRSRADVDPARIGIYGGSYGGFLTALALARDSDLFRAGVDIHGVHNFTTAGSGAGAALQAGLAMEPPDREQAQRLAWQSSPVSAVGTWRSPVLLIHADDDRNVRFSQTIELVQRLATSGVPFEELVIPDDTHHWMRHANVLTVHRATAAFFERRFQPSPPPSTRPSGP
jgi:dipeptidyl aminopeptidase/acylaminoacyl peptidase